VDRRIPAAPGWERPKSGGFDAELLWGRLQCNNPDMDESPAKTPGLQRKPGGVVAH